MDCNTVDTLSDFPYSSRCNKEVIFQSITAYWVLLNQTYNGSGIARIDSGMISSFSEINLKKAVLFNPNKVTKIKPATGANYKNADGNEIPFEDGSYYYTRNYKPGFTPN